MPPETTHTSASSDEPVVHLTPVVEAAAEKTPKVRRSKKPSKTKTPKSKPAAAKKPKVKAASKKETKMKATKKSARKSLPTKAPAAKRGNLATRSSQAGHKAQTQVHMRVWKEITAEAKTKGIRPADVVRNVIYKKYHFSQPEA